MAKLTLNDITGISAATLINANSALIEAALENTLSRDGTTPNEMGADLDMNSYDINNVTDMRVTNLYVDGELIDFDALGGGISGITIQEEGTPLATLATTLNFIGANVTAAGTGATKTITVSAGGGIPGGADTQMQYNNGGAFGGTAEWTFANGTGKLTGTAEFEVNDRILFGSVGDAADGDPYGRLVFDAALPDSEDVFLGFGFQDNASVQYELAAANVSPAGIFLRGTGGIGSVTLAADHYNNFANTPGTDLGNPDGWGAAIEVDGRETGTGSIIRLRIAGTTCLNVQPDGANYITQIRDKLEMTSTGYVDSYGYTINNLTAPIPTMGGTNFHLWVDSNGGGGTPIFKVRDDADVDIMELYDAKATFGNYVFNIDQTVGAGQDNYVLTYDNATGEIGLEASAGGATSPGGSFNQVQYNDSGVFGGLAGFTVNDVATTTSMVAIGSQAGLTSGNVLTIDNSSGVTAKTGQVMVVSNSDTTASPDVLVLDQNGPAGDLLVLKDAGTEVTVFDGAGYLIDYPGAPSNGEVLAWNAANSRYEVGPVTQATFGPIFINEQAAADADVPGDGQYWVYSSAPNIPVFTGDTGLDYRLAKVITNELSIGAVSNHTIISGIQSVPGVDEIVIHFDSLSVSTPGNLYLQVGSGGSVETSGYVSVAAYVSSTTTNTINAVDRIYITTGNVLAADVLYGNIVFRRQRYTTNEWTWTGQIASSTGDLYWFAGHMNLLNTNIGIIELNCSAGTFDAGVTNISY